MYNLTMTLYPRFLEPKILELLAVSPVVIIEGARAVGKTSLVNKLAREGQLKAVYSMADTGLRALVESDTVGWLRSLDWPCAIDEAQLVPELPLAIKQILDESQDSIRLLLTGSSSIGQSGFGGTDPLARRALRVSLEPLSEAEMRSGDGQAWSLVDALFDALPLAGAQAQPLEVTSDALVLGGMPQYRRFAGSSALPALGLAIDEGVRSILTQQVKPGESFDQLRAQEILSYILRHPASELNISEVGRELSMDRRTVDAYLDALEKRFLVYEVPNLHRPSKKSLRSSAKFFPADVALSARSLVSSSDAQLLDADVRGRLLETLVMQQVQAHAGWANRAVEVFHWRQRIKSRDTELDLVLRDSSGALLALEVKASARVKPEFLRGLKAFQELYGERVSRGFVVCNVTQPLPLGENVWALPFAALWDASLWQGLVARSDRGAVLEPLAEVEHVGEKPDADVRLLASFAAADDGSALAGDIRGFLGDVADAVEGLSGLELELILDDEPAMLAETLGQMQESPEQSPQLLLPVLTPRWVKQVGDASFLEEENLLPLLWIARAQLPDWLKESALDLTVARRAEPGSADYRAAVEDLAERILERLSAE